MALQSNGLQNPTDSTLLQLSGLQTPVSQAQLDAKRAAAQNSDYNASAEMIDQLGTFLRLPEIGFSEALNSGRSTANTSSPAGVDLTGGVYRNTPTYTPASSTSGVGGTGVGDGVGDYLGASSIKPNANAQTQAYNRAYLADQNQMLMDLLGRIDASRASGIEKIGKQYDTEIGLSNQDKERQMAQYEDNRIAQTQGREKAFGEANQNANNAFRSLSQIIGRGAGTGSSAFRELLPDALNKGLNTNRGSAIENYATNMQSIKKSEDQYGLDFARVLQDLLDQRTQQQNTLESGIESQRQGIYGQQATIAGKMQENENPNASYESIKASQNPYRDLINQSSNKISQYDAYTPEFKRTQVVAATPNINEYTTNRAAVNAQAQGLDPNNIYSSLLRKRLQEQG